MAGAATEERWIEGRNGGRLRPGGTHGPKRATIAVRRALVEALRDPRGGSGKEFFVALKTGSAEDRRTFASICTRLIPVEVQGDLGETLKVNIVTLVAAPNGEELPVNGTCVIGESARNAPMPAPITVKTEEVRR